MMSDASSELSSGKDAAGQELEQAYRDLWQVRSVVAGAVQQMGTGIHEVVKESAAQQELLSGLLSQVKSDAKGGGRFAQFVFNNEDLVGRIAGNLEESSQRVLGLVEQLGAVESAFRKLNAFSSSILEVSERIRILALNANLEATRAGAAGRGFAVVAGAVRELSNSYRTLTEEIRDTVDNASQTLTDTMVKAQAAAVVDQATVQNARTQMQRLQLSTVALRREMGETLQQAHQMNESIHHGVGECLNGLQFNETVGHICQVAHKRMESCQSHSLPLHLSPQAAPDVRNGKFV
jgi:methyl-accepting chemotaxis protein